MLHIDTIVCDGCGTCIGVCPENALTLGKKLEVDHSLCSRCGTCVSICPFGALGLGSEKQRVAK